MTSITRAQYRRAIRAGIAAAGDLMPPVTQAKLLLHAEWDTEFGTNFDSKPLACPMGRMGYFPAPDTATYEFSTRFAHAFDSAWSLLMPRGWWGSPVRSQVIKVVG